MIILLSSFLVIRSLSRKEIFRVKSTTHVKATTNTFTSFACGRQVEPKCGLYPKNVLNSGPKQKALHCQIVTAFAQYYKLAQCQRCFQFGGALNQVDRKHKQATLS